MAELAVEVGAFTRRKREERRQAARMVAFFLATGIDLDAALDSGRRERSMTVARLERLIERERLRGLARHWAYNLDRHIALKEALDALRGASGAGRQRLAKKIAAPVGAAVGRLGHEGQTRTTTCACAPAPSSWPAASGQPRSSGRPSDNSHPGPTSRDTAPASGRNGS